MTLEEFTARALREYRNSLSLPANAWGEWRRVWFASGARVVFSSSRVWRIYGPNGAFVSAHDSRIFAIKKASKLVAGIKSA